jgi:DtxR family Mn-dependent transcriptional regulator
MLSARTIDYLETVYLLSLERDTVGVSQVAAERNVTIPTARSAIKRLRDAGYVRQERYGKIMLTDAGRKRAEAVYRTHSVIFRFLHDVLGVEESRADSEACVMEHGLSEDTRARLARFLEGRSVAANGSPADKGSVSDPHGSDGGDRRPNAELDGAAARPRGVERDDGGTS